jgi:mRNA interferase MazF
VKRGDIYLADLNPSQGSEANKVRPVLLVARNDALAAISRHRRGVVTVVPMTSNDRIRGPMHVLVQPSPLNGLRVASKAQAEQVRSVDVARLSRRVGRLSRADLTAVVGALRYHLAL